MVTQPLTSKFDFPQISFGNSHPSQQSQPVSRPSQSTLGANTRPIFSQRPNPSEPVFSQRPNPSKPIFSQRPKPNSSGNFVVKNRNQQ